MPSNGFSLELPIGKVSKVKGHHDDVIYSVEQTVGTNFAEGAGLGS